MVRFGGNYWAPTILIVPVLSMSYRDNNLSLRHLALPSGIADFGLYGHFLCIINNLREQNTSVLQSGPPIQAVLSHCLSMHYSEEYAGIPQFTTMC